MYQKLQVGTYLVNQYDNLLSYIRQNEFNFVLNIHYWTFYPSQQTNELACMELHFEN